MDSQVCSKNLERLNADDHGLVPMDRFPAD